MQQNQTPQLVAGVLALGLALLVAWARSRHWLGEVNLGLQDRFARLAFHQQGFPQDCPVVLVSIDERSLTELKLPYTLWRPQMAEVVSRLCKAEAKVIALDVLFGLRPETFASHGREYAPLQRSLEDAERKLAGEIFDGPIVVAAHLDREARLEDSCPPLMGAAGDRLGWVNLDQDRDGAVRHFDLFEPVRRKPGEPSTWMPSMALRVSTLASGHVVEPEQPLWQGRPIPQEEGLVRIHYRGPSGQIPRISFVDVLAGRDLDRVQGKIVLLGLTDPRFGDHHRSPFSVHGESDMAGVEIQAYAAWTLLSGDFVQVAPPGIQVLVIVGAGLLAGRLAWLAPLRNMALLGAAFPPFWLGVCGLAYLFHRVLLDGVGPIASLLLVALGVYAWRAATVEGLRRELQATFGRMVSPQVMRGLERDPELARRREHREVTVLFTDINNFTPTCEASTPEQIMDALGVYFAGMVEIIHRHDGTIKQYVGDEIMVIFGAPHDQPDHAARAVQTALDMQTWLAEKQAQSAGGSGFFDIKIGIHTGPVVCGMVGAVERMEYAAVGDNVNLGSRIMNATKQVGFKLLLSEATRSQAEPYLPQVEWLSFGEQEFKGKSQRVPLFGARLKEVK
jgi:adenylate cyclase